VRKIVSDDLDFDLPEPRWDPYADETALGIERDWWDRPLILPDPQWPTFPGWPDGQVEKRQMADGRRPYRRMSSMATMIDPGYGLAIWKLRHTSLAIARRPDLQVLLCGLTYQDGKAIDAVVDEALVRAKDDDTDPEYKLRAANYGTAFHTFTTPGCPDVDPVFGPTLADYRIAVDAFHEALEISKLEIVSSERFVVNDPLRAAGTYDHLVLDRTDGRVKVLDSKSGKMQWLSHVVQVEGYSNARHYDPATGRREPLHPDLDVSEGFIAHAELSTGKVHITTIDLTTGKSRLATDVHVANQADTVKRLVKERRTA
jgi:hypothetical protein